VTPAAAVGPRVAKATADLDREFSHLDGDGSRPNPVGAARALQRIARRHPLRLSTERDALRWHAEKLLAPHFRGMDTQRASKAVVWLALDAAWPGGGHGPG